MKTLVVLIGIIVYTTCQTVTPTSSDVTTPTIQVPTSSTNTILPTDTKLAIDVSGKPVEVMVKEDKYHHCTACPFESDHHKCNDPFLLSKSFEVSADMCNAINADKSQVDRLCKRYPKGYFFQCPRDGSSYTCKASCGVQVEDVGKGLLDADITDMPNGLLSGLGFGNKKESSHSGPQEPNLFSNMGNLFHPIQHQMPAEHFPMHPRGTQNHFNPVQFQNPATNHLRAPHDPFAGPHNRYPGANPSFAQNENHFGVQPNHFVGFPGNQFNTPPQPHHHVFGGLPGFNQNVNPHLSTGFRESPPPQPSPKTYMPSPPSQPAIAQQPSTSNPSAMPNNPAGIAFQNPTNVPSFTQHVDTLAIPVSQPTDLAPAATGQPNHPAPAAIVQPNHPAHAAKAQPNHSSPAATAQNRQPVPNPTDPFVPRQDSHNAGFGVNRNRRPVAQQPMNHMGAFGPFGSHPHDTFSQQNNFLQSPMQPLHNFGPSGFMKKPVQNSASKATSNIHHFMGGFDDFNNGFHGFSNNIGRKSPPKDTRNKGSFFSNLFNFKRR